MYLEQSLKINLLSEIDGTADKSQQVN